MTTVTSFTSERMLEIENETITDAHLSGDNLILTTREGTNINVGSVRGPTGATGATGSTGTGFAVGQLGEFPKSPLPSRWLECDGTTKSIATYPALAAYLGTTYGGNGTTTFGLPGYNGRVLVGRDPGGYIGFDTVGEVGGELAHTLITNEMPSHNHTHSLAAPAHTHPMSHVHGAGAGGAFGFLIGVPGTGTQATVVGTNVRIDGNTSEPNNANTGAASATALTGVIDYAGLGIGHNNVQPYRVVYIAIYAGP